MASPWAPAAGGNLATRFSGLRHPETRHGYPAAPVQWHLHGRPHAGCAAIGEGSHFPAAFSLIFNGASVIRLPNGQLHHGPGSMPGKAGCACHSAPGLSE